MTENIIFIAVTVQGFDWPNTITVRKGMEGARDRGEDITIDCQDLRSAYVSFIYHNVPIGHQCNLPINYEIAYKYGLVKYER